MKAFVIGHPVSHSLSPAIFAIFSQTQQCALDYTAMDIAPENLTSFIKKLRFDAQFIGANITIPHKESVLALVDELSDDAKIIGAANVIVANKNKFTAHNTDWIGIQRTLEKANFDSKNKNVLVLGAGGSARAACYAIAKKSAREIFIYNPRSARGDELCNTMKSHFPNILFHSLRTLNDISEMTFDLVINCTPIGMRGETTTYFDALKKLKYASNALAFDLLYMCKELPFLNVMKKSGIATIHGLDMLIAQAIATVEIWINPVENRDSLHQKIRDVLMGILHLRENDAPIFLTGFMGVGKSTVGAALAKLTQRIFMDTDHMIEASAGSTVKDIFAQQGEASFRDFERQAVKTSVKSSNSIVALGGGALLSDDHVRLIKNIGILVCLGADEKTISERISWQGHKRPLLDGQKISELFRQRKPGYEQADFLVMTTGLKTIEVVFSILSAIGTK